MLVKYLKKIPLHSGSSDTKSQKIVRHILRQVEPGSDEKVIEYAAK